ncbi:hypothetical protein M569_15676, partial [Genlisea aurea]
RVNDNTSPETRTHLDDGQVLVRPSLRSHEMNFSESKPVLNYSIQTGEEFEFMRDIVNQKNPFITNISGDPRYAPGYLELKSILGVSHTVSEAGSDSFAIGTTEKSSVEHENINLSLHGNVSRHGSLYSVPQISSNRASDQTFVYPSSGASENSSQKLKILCSFGGGIIPRPSDGKLRYVGGEMRMIRISKDIMWREFREKTTAIYNETHAIKYQLPGEDLDALVSVSGDEDLLNMMEECNILEDGEGLKRLRIFLFSVSDLEDAHFSLANVDGDSEMKYIVAVNGIDIESGKGSTLQLASCSGNNLDEFDQLNFERDSGGASTEFFGTNNSNLHGFVGHSATVESSKSVLANSSTFFEAGLPLHHSQTIPHHDEKHPLGSLQTFVVESTAQQAPYGVLPQEKDLEGEFLAASAPQFIQMQEKELKMKLGGSTIHETNQITMLMNDPSAVHSSRSKVSFSAEDSPLMVSKRDSEARPLETLQSTRPSGVGNPSQLPKTVGSEYLKSSNAPDLESIVSEHEHSDLIHTESALVPQRVFYSERIPREQAGSHARMSKSDDSHGSQYLVNQSRTDITEPDLETLSLEKLQNGEDASVEQLVYVLPDEAEIIDGHSELPKVDSSDIKIPSHEHQVPMVDLETLSRLPDSILDDSSKPSEDSKSQWVDEVMNQSLANDSRTSTWLGTPEDSKASVPKTEQGDILIDINDRFPRDLLSDIFSKAILSDCFSNIGPLQKDAAGLSVKLENHEPKHWSFFQRLAGDEFAKSDVSLMDQDHIVFSSGLTKVEEDAPVAYDFGPMLRDGIPPSHIGLQGNYGEYHEEITANDGPGLSLHSNFKESPAKVDGGNHFDDLMDNMRIQESEYEGGVENMGMPSLDLLMDFDIKSLQIIRNADLEELRELGSGTFGTVYHGKWRGSDVAIKRIKKSCFTGRQSEQERLTCEFWREAEILSKLHHPNVVAFYGVVHDGPGGTLATVTEFMVDGSLRHVLVRKD